MWGEAPHILGVWGSAPADFFPTYVL